MTSSPHPVRVLWLMGSDRPKADTISLLRWLRASDRAALSMAVSFLSEPSGLPAPAGEFAGQDGSPQTIPQALSACGAEVVRWGGTSVRRIVSFVRDREIDVLVSAYLRADVLAGHVRKLTAVRWIARAGGIGRFRRTRLYGGDWLDRLIYRRADGFLANAQAVGDDWSARLRRRAEDFRVIHNAVPRPPANLSPRQAIRDRLAIAADERMVLTVGRLDREKGIELLIDAAAMVGKTGPGDKARFIVLGDGPRRARLQRRIEQLGLRGRVQLVGHSGDVWSHLAAADAFVLPSRMEGCSNALLEAASSGLPLVAFGVGAVPELVGDEQEALLAGPESGPAGLAERISRLLSDRVLADRLGRAAQARARAQFDPRAIAARHEEFLAGLRQAQ